MNIQEFLHKLVTTPYDFFIHYGGPFVVVLSALIFVHEWGHYIVARRCGVKVVKFSIGFGRELFGRDDKNGTRWKVCVFPLGGYVQMFGDVDPASAQHTEGVAEGDKVRPHTPEERKVAFYAQPLSKRAAIVAAGPLINYFFAIIILTGLYTLQGEPFLPPIADQVLDGSAAAAAGMQVDDKILSINGQKIERFEDIREITQLSIGRPMVIELVHALNVKSHPVNAGDKTGKKAGGKADDKAAKAEAAQAADKMDPDKVVWSDKPVTLTITPKTVIEYDRFGFKTEIGRLGIGAPGNASAKIPHTLVSAFAASAKTVWHITADTLQAMGQMLEGTRSTDELGGILRIGAYAGESAQDGWISFITFAALLSVNLGLINILPIPLLDGGYLAMYAMEKLRGRPLNEQIQEYALRVGLVFILGIMFLATWNDLVQLKVVDHVKNLLSL